MSVTRSAIPQLRGISRRRLLGYVGVGLVSSLMNPSLWMLSQHQLKLRRRTLKDSCWFPAH